MTKLLSATALASAAFIVPTAVSAQTTSVPQTTATTDSQQAEVDQSEADGQGGSITVTGSRIRRPNLDSTTPVTSLDAAQVLNTGNLSLGDALNELPALRSTFNQANSTRFIGTAGINTLDLRGLGSDRTLVLVNGRRHVTSSPGSYTVDTNTIPNNLLERVDIVTGGTSAVYGSDAVAGVVNFILKRDFDGIQIGGQGGISDRGDRGSYSLNGVIGKNFADGRGNIALSAEYARSNPVFFSQRNDQTGALTGAPGFYTNEFTVGEPPEGDGIPDTAFYGVNPGSRFSNRSIGGTVVPVCPADTAANALRRSLVCSGGRAATALGGPGTGVELADVYNFAPDGSLVRNRFEIDNRSFGGGVFGGDTATGLEGAMLLPGLERYNFNLLGHFEVSSAFRPYFEAKYVDITANQTSTQPTFNGSVLSSTYSINNPFLTPQARATLQQILAPGSTTFISNRFNNDIGTRAEDHERKTYRFLAGVEGDLSTTGNLRYDVFGSFGRTETYYETGGNVILANYNAAINAVRNSAGQIVCAVNADAITTNDRPDCVPLNTFGAGLASREALDYILYTSSREQWAEQINAVAAISGDSTGLFELPGGPVGFSIGAEYRREDAFSDFDDFTQSGATFLNSIAQFDPPAVSLYEGFGELRVPLLRDTFIHELTLEGAARYSKYSTSDDGVWAYNFGGVFAPIRDFRVRAGYARSVRAPNLGNLYATPSETFANAFVDPCSQSAINNNPNRVRNCAAAGVPTTLTYTTDDGVVTTIPWQNTLGGGLLGINQGNLNLQPEVGKSFTVGAIFEPRFLPGFSLSVDYYDITVENVIAGLSGQGIVNRCYDDPVGLDNPFCSAVFRRSSADPLANFTFDGQSDRTLPGVAGAVVLPRLGPGFLNQPFNYAALKTSGIDADLSYRRTFDNGVRLSVRGVVSWLEKREQFVFITAPEQSVRVHGVLGDPEWRGRMSVGVSNDMIDVGYDLNYIGRQTIGAWETQFSHQGRPPQNADAFPFKWYPSQITHDIQIGVRANEQFRFYIGVDNLLDTLPPYGLTGTGEGSGIFGVVGRYFYTGVRVTL